MMAEELRRLLEQLPPHNLDLWREILYFLHEITLQAEINKMNPTNLGIVWGPNVFWDEQVRSPSLLLSHSVTGLVALIVTCHTQPMSPSQPSLSSPFSHHLYTTALSNHCARTTIDTASPGHERSGGQHDPPAHRYLPCTPKPPPRLVDWVQVLTPMCVCVCVCC
jgi:hypothetical protein